MERIQLEKFNLSTIMPNSTILVLGKRRSGKSWLLRDICYNHKSVSYGVVFSGTEEASPFFSNFIPDIFIHSRYDRNLLEEGIELQKKRVVNAGHKCTPTNRMLVLIDDMLDAAQEWSKDSLIKHIFFNGRHYNIFFILTMQYPIGIPPSLRSNIDYVFVFAEPSMKNRKKIYDDYGGMFPTFNHFSRTLDACSENHECLVLKTAGGTSNNISDQVFWYKAEQPPPFKLGDKKIWDLQKRFYNKDYQQTANTKDKYANSKLKLLITKEGGVEINE